MKPCIHGHVSGRLADGRCKECHRLSGRKRYAETPKEIRKARNAAWYATNKNKQRAYRDANKERDKATRRADYVKRRAVLLIKGAKHRAKEINVPFDLGEHATHYQMVIDAGFCQATGLPFDLRTSGSMKNRNPFSPSLDRIEPKLGYVYGNVRVVLWGFNRALSDWGDQTYATIAKAYLKNNPWI
jgi:hypothetical protein